MSESINNATIKITADASGVEAELRKVDSAAARTGKSVEDLGRADGIGKLGANAEIAATKFGFAGKTIIDAIQKQTLAAERGTKGTKDYFETWANQKGINPALLKPYLDQLDAVTRKTAEAAAAQSRLDSSNKFLEGLRSQAAEIGKSNSQLLEMRAAQLGVSESAKPMIEQLRQAEEASGGLSGALGISKEALLGLAAGLASAVSIGAFVAGVGAAIDSLADLDDMAQKTGSSVESLSRLQKVASVVGQDFAQVDAAVSKLAKGMGGLDEDSNKVTSALKRLGVSTKDLAQQDPSEVLVKAAKNLQNYADDARKTALINDLLGKSGADLLPYLNDLAEKVDDYTGASAAAAKQAGDFQNEVGALRVRSEELYTSIAQKILPAMSDLAGVFADAAKNQDDLVTPDAETWADNLAVGLARVVDVAILLPRILSAVGGSFKAVLADASVAKALLENASASPALAAQSIANIRRAIDERNAVLAAANADYDRLWNAPANQIEQSMLKRLADRTKAVKDGMDAAFPFGLLEAGKPSVGAAPSAPDTSANDKLAASYATLTASIQEKIAATAQEASGLPPLTESQKLLIKLDQELLAGKLKLDKQDEARYRLQIKDLALQEQIRAGLLRSIELDKIRADYGKELGKSVADALREAEANENLVRTFGLSKSAIELLTVARMEERLEQIRQIDGAEDEVKALELVIDAKKRSAAALGSAEALAENKRANDAMLAEWQKAVDKYDDVFRDGFADMLNNGVDGWKSFTKSLVTTFKTTVADQIYKMFAQKFVVQLVGNFTGATGGSTLATAAQALSGSGGGDSALGNASSLLSAGKSIYSAFSGGISSGLGGVMSQLGTTFGSSAISSFGAGLSATSTVGGTGNAAMLAWAQSSGNVAAGASAGASAGAYAIPIAGWIAAGMALSNNLYKKGWDAQNGTLNSGGQIFGSATLALNSGLQKLGLSNSLANMLSGASTISRLFGRKNPEITDQGLSGTFNATGFAGEKYANILEKGGVFRSDKKYSETYSVGDQLDSSFDQTIKNMLATVQDFGEAMGLEVGQIDGYTKQIKLSLTSDSAKNDELIAGLFGDIGNDLARLLIPAIDSLSRSGETAADALQRLGTNYVVIDEALAAMGDTFGAVGIGSLSARQRLVDLAGGLESFSRGAAFFAQNYLSQAEQTEALAKKVGDALDELGISGVTTRDQFKNIVLGLDLTTEKGATTYAGLMNIQEAFAALNPAIESSMTALDLSNARRDQEIQIMELAGNKAGALAAARALELAGLDAALRPNQERINQLKDEATALTVANQLLSLQAQIHELTGNKAGAAAVLQEQHIAALAALDPALRSATERLYGLEAAAKSVQGAKDTAAGLISDVDNAFSVLQRMAAAEKERATTAHNLNMARLQDGIDTESAALTLRKAQASNAVANAKSLSEALRSALNQVRIVGNEAPERNSAQAQIQAALAIARAGGPLPAAENIKEALSTLAQDSSNQFSTFEDYLRDAYRTQADIAALSAISDSSLSIQEQTLKVLEDQKGEIAAQKEIAMLAYQDEIDRLDSIVGGAQQSIDHLKGIDTSNLTIVQALEAVRLAIVVASQNQLAGSAAPINEAYKQSLGRTPDATGLAYWQNAIAGGTSTESVISQITNSMEAQIQGLYKSLLGRNADAAGLDFFLKSGSSVADIYRNITESNEYKARQSGNPAARPAAAVATGSQSGSNARVTELLEALITTVSDGNAHTERLADLIDDVTEGGNGMRADIIANSGAITI